MNIKLMRASLMTGVVAGLAVSASANLVINPTFDSSITTNANGAQMMATINQAIAVYQNMILDPITVNIRFVDSGSGLGASSASTIHVTYGDLRSHMVTDATSADDNMALAHLPVQANDPVTNASTGVDITTAQARALGFTTNVSSDCTIWLNSSICHFDHGVNHNSYDYFTVASHEITEALGAGGWGSNIGFAPGIAMLDLFRYDEFGNRTFTTSGAHHAYFSLDGTTHIDEFNQINYSGGDYADWIVHGTPQIQDWAGTTGPGADMVSSEWRALDVSGYDFTTVPEPGSFLALGLGLAFLSRRRRK
ncbi:MAG: NF038122 family metalloprotease [Armatimonadetes bacterium]|nr:PEP-CTERM sorting domain-containing protein [Armatimonadota bacterium]MBS1702339.1 NF038122 family metalloprotease [Armatimonadota bacterium]MBS1726333.1 NF038122 family metalloprotease [Armatimonadota bacterium]